MDDDLSPQELSSALAGTLTVDQGIEYRAFSSWCLLTTAATFAALPLAIIEARAALQRFTEEQHDS